MPRAPVPVLSHPGIVRTTEKLGNAVLTPYSCRPSGRLTEVMGDVDGLAWMVGALSLFSLVLFQDGGKIIPQLMGKPGRAAGRHCHFVALPQCPGTDIAARDFALAVSATVPERYLIDLCGCYETRNLFWLFHSGFHRPKHRAVIPSKATAHSGGPPPGCAASLRLSAWPTSSWPGP